MNITFIGGGNMATAIIGGLRQEKDWIHNTISVVEIDPAARQKLEQTFGIKSFSDIDDRALNADCLVLAVKPQNMRQVAVQLGSHLKKGQIVLSIAAGIRLTDLARWLGTQNCILVRAMPNTPALIGAGITSFYSFPPQHLLAPQQRKQIESVMEAVGTVLWVRSEEDIDAVTAISGSGPAYVFYFIEALEQAALELKLPPEIAKKLALETFLGSAKLALASNDPVATLRERVTSKGGTTERALKAMETDGIKNAIIRAVKAAADRSRELGDELGRD
jgi:pyrroline-5-carboxylate reductase